MVKSSYEQNAAKVFDYIGFPGCKPELVRAATWTGSMMQQAVNAIQIDEAFEIGREICESQGGSLLFGDALPSQQGRNRCRINRGYLGKVDFFLSGGYRTNTFFKGAGCISDGEIGRWQEHICAIKI